MNNYINVDLNYQILAPELLYSFGDLMQTILLSSENNLIERYTKKGKKGEFIKITINDIEELKQSINDFCLDLNSKNKTLLDSFKKILERQTNGCQLTVFIKH